MGLSTYQECAYCATSNNAADLFCASCGAVLLQESIQSKKIGSQPLLLSLHGKGLLLLQTSLVPLSFSEPQGVLYRTLVANDGTFTIKMRIPATAKSGSKLTIIAQITGANPQNVKPVEYHLTVAS